MRILLVEDDPTLGPALQEFLTGQDWEVDLGTTFDQGLTLSRKFPYDCCVLDVNLPDASGFDLGRAILSGERPPGVLFLTARSFKADKLRGFEIGADDYLTKPVDEDELVARIRAVVRRGGTVRDTPPEITIGAFTFRPATLLLVHPRLPDRQLTEREGKLLQLLAEERGQILDREYVLKTVWEQNDYFTRRSMDVFISRLRKYLAPEEGIKIRNVYGRGFILEV